MKTKTSLLFASLSLLAAGCAVGPDYQKPAANAPAHWSEPLAGGETGQTASVATWWKNFNDPELNSLVERAVAANLDLKIAESRVREARAEAGISEAAFGPTVNANGSAVRTATSTHQPVLGSLQIPGNVPFVNNVYQAGFDASWEIDVFGGTRRAVEGANAEVVAAEYNQKDVQVTLIAEVARNYVEARGFQRRLAIAQENIKAQSDALGLTKDRFQKGIGNDLDTQQASTVLSQTQAQIPVFESGLETAVHHLGVLLGQSPGALMTELAAAAPIPASPPQVPVGLPSELLLRRPDVRQAEANFAAATARIGVATADLFPKFSLTGTAGFESVSTSDWFNPGSKFWSLGPTVQWRIFDAGRIRANIRVQNAKQEQALAAYEKTVLTSFEDVENALVAYAKEQVRHQSLTQAVASSQDALNLSNQLYANGLTNFINVLDSERAMYQTQDDLVQSDKAVTQNLIALYKALGGGWETGEAEQTAQIKTPITDTQKVAAAQ
jgi:NodT family efflux transporter outer membrane factor (OMF) lipoprotein